MTRAKSTSSSAGSAADRIARSWVSFVGSGPGDPDLLTVRAVDLLRQADVIITEAPEHDGLVRRLLGLPAPVVVDADAAGTSPPTVEPASRSAPS